MLKSTRDLPLVLTELPKGQPVLTVENCCKWYDVFIVFPDGKVDKVDLYRICYAGTIWSDHVPNPKACLEVAALLNVAWDGQSFEMIVGRYMLERLTDKWDAILKEL